MTTRTRRPASTGAGRAPAPTAFTGAAANRRSRGWSRARRLARRDRRRRPPQPPPESPWAEDRPAPDPLAGAPEGVRGALAAGLDDDASLSLRLRGSSADVSLETEEGRLNVHLRVRAGGAQVRLSGAAAAILAGRRAELGQALNQQGLTLSEVTVEDGAPGDAEETTEPGASPRPGAGRRKARRFKNQETR
jgi:hypothetical protein